MPRTPAQDADWRRTAGKSAIRPPAEDTRTRPAYHAARGMTSLANGGRKRHIGGVA